MKRLTILVDADDTIECLAEAWLSVLNERYGTSVTVDDLTDWHVPKFFPSLTQEEVYAPLREDATWDRVRPRRDAALYLQRLVEDGHAVFIVTATHHDTYKAKMEKVILKYFPYIHRTDVIVAYNKKMVRGDVRVDDGVHNLEGCDGLKILIDASHNRKYDAEANDMYRVRCWDEAYRIINDYANEEGSDGDSALLDRVPEVLCD